MINNGTWWFFFASVRSLSFSGFVDLYSTLFTLQRFENTRELEFILRLIRVINCYVAEIGLSYLYQITRIGFSSVVCSRIVDLWGFFVCDMVINTRVFNDVLGSLLLYGCIITRDFIIERYLYWEHYLQWWVFLYQTATYWDRRTYWTYRYYTYYVEII